MSFFKAGPSPKLDSSTKVDPAPQSTASVPVLGQKKGTCNLAQYNVNEPSLSKFQEYLQNIEGKVRKPRVACAIAVDASKSLAFFSSSDPSVSPHGSLFSKRQRYTDNLEVRSCWD